MSLIKLGYVIASKAPHVLAQFYSCAFGLEIQGESTQAYFYLINSEGMKLHIYRPSRKAVWPPKGMTCSICAEKDNSSMPLIDIKKWSDELIKKGAASLEDPREENFGAECWMADPEGNYFLILVTKI